MEREENPFDLLRDWGVEGDALAGHGVGDCQPGREQQKAMDIELFPPKAVVRAVAVRGVADDRVGNVFAVASELMPAPGGGGEFNQRVTGGGMGPDGVWQFGGGEAA